MGVCHSQKKRNLELNVSSKRSRSTPKSFLSLQIPNNEGELEQQQDKKRSSRLSNTRNSLILAHKIGFSQMDNSYRQQSMWARIQQPMIMIPFQFMSQESKDSFEVSDHSINIQDVFALHRNQNNLKQIAQSSIFLNFPNYDKQKFEAEELEFKLSIIPLENASLNLSNESPIQMNNRQKYHLKQEKKQKSLQLPQNTSILQIFNSQKQIQTKITQGQIKKNNLKLINLLCSETQNSPNKIQLQNEIIETLSTLMESMQFNSLNPYAIIWIMRKILQEDGIELILSAQNDKSGAYSRQTSFKQNLSRSRGPSDNVLNFNQISVLSTNMSKFYFEISFKDDIQYNFRKIFGCTMSKKSFMAKLENHIKVSLPKDQFDSQIYWIKATIQNTVEYLNICFYVPSLTYAQSQRFMRTLEEQITINYTINGIQMFELVNWLNISMTIFDAWGNREYKTYLTEQEEFNQENDFFKYVRPVGWKYHDFYLDSCRRFGLRQDEGIKAEKGQFVNGYMKLLMKPNGSSSFFQILHQAVDIGPNNDIFESLKCGNGIIITQNIAHLLPTGSESMIPIDFRLKPIRLIIQKEVHYYYVVLQVKIEKTEIRIPENFGIQVFIVNNYQKVINEGILIKELNEMEYNEAIKLLPN